MSPSTKKPAPKTPKAEASTKVVRPKTPAERVAERYTGPNTLGIVSTWRLDGIQSRLRGLGMPTEEVERIMAEVRASLGVEQ